MGWRDTCVALLSKECQISLRVSAQTENALYRENRTRILEASCTSRQRAQRAYVPWVDSMFLCIRRFRKEQVIHQAMQKGQGGFTAKKNTARITIFHGSPLNESRIPQTLDHTLIECRDETWKSNLVTDAHKVWDLHCIMQANVQECPEDLRPERRERSLCNRQA